MNRFSESSVQVATYTRHTWEAFFAQAEKIHFLMAFAAFLLSLLLLPFFFRGNPGAANGRRLCGILFLLAIAFQAGSTVVYTLAIFIVATLITNENFLSRLAAIWWNRPWAIIRGASPEETQRKIDEEAALTREPPLAPIPLREIPAHPATFATPRSNPRLRAMDEMPTHSERSLELAFERQGFAALEAAGIFDRLRFDIALASASEPQQALTVVDGLAGKGTSDFVVEVIRELGEPKAVIAQMRFAIDIFRNTATFRSKLIKPTVRGLVVTGSSPGPDFLAENIACLYFNPVSQTFTNLDPIQAWILTPHR